MPESATISFAVSPYSIDEEEPENIRQHVAMLGQFFVLLSMPPKIVPNFLCYPVAGAALFISLHPRQAEEYCCCR